MCIYVLVALPGYLLQKSSRSFSSMAVMSSPTALSWTRRRFSSSKSAITYRHTHIQTSGQERWLIMTAPPNKQWAYIISYELMMFEVTLFFLCLWV